MQAAVTNTDSAGASSSPYFVDLGYFSGPLDLLLHLVRREELPIEEVEMSKIAEQYLRVIETAAQLDLEVATEFLVVAATLLAIKSESVLPSNQGELDEELMGEGSEFYEELRERLKRYEQTKKRATLLRARPQLGIDTFHRVDRALTAPVPELFEIKDSPQSLGEMFVGLLKRIGETAQSIRIKLEPVSVIDCMMRMIQTLESSIVGVGASNTFMGLLGRFVKTDRAGQRRADAVTVQSTRGAVIGNFIAVLELVKRGILNVTQLHDAADIRIALRMNADIDYELKEDREVDHVIHHYEETHPNVVPLRPREDREKDDSQERKEVNRD